MLVKQPQIHIIAKYTSTVFMALTGIILIGLQVKPFGWLMLLAGALSLLLATKTVAKHYILIFTSLVILGLVPIDTSIAFGDMVVMGSALLIALAIPFVVTRYVYKEEIIKFMWHHGRGWYKREVLYIFVTALAAYLILPFYFQNTGAYLNWSAEPGVWNITKLFIGTNALGIWDELFFIATVLALLKRHVKFGYANIIQAVLFTGFLYELGFTGWAPLLIYPFALLQGYIYKHTESLLYVITIHLTLDFILFLAILNAHHPTWVPIFITG